MKEATLREPEHTGRDTELALLLDNVRDCFDGKGSTVLIGGEAGIGKTRLVKELIREVKNQNIRVLKGWCLAETLEPLMPFRSALSEISLEYLISGDPPPLVVSVYLINDAGLLLAKKDSEEYGRDPAIFAAMLKAVGDFVHDSLEKFGHSDTGGLSSIGFMDFNIVIEDLDELHLACVIKGRISEFLIKDMRKVLERVRNGFGGMLETWNGDMEAIADIEPMVEWLITCGKYDGKFLVDDPRIRQENLFDNVLLGLRRFSADRPSLIFLDDLQWADPTTLNLLHYLARNTGNDRVLIVGTYRPEDILRDSGEGHHLEATIQNMNREGLIELIGLSRLGLKETESIIASSLGEVAFDESFYGRIYSETEGTPLFILEIVRLLIQDKAIRQDGKGRWSLVTDLENLNLPSRVYDVLKRRLDRLNKEHRKILDCGSVMGVEFRSEVLGKALGTDRMRLLEHLNEIEKSHRLIKSRKGGYRFDHTKLKEVLYEAISPELRAGYHNMIADAIEEVHMDNLDDYLAELAHHYYMAGNDRALRYLKRAGEKAEAANAYYEAIEFYGSALLSLDFGGRHGGGDREYIGLSMKIGYLHYWLGDMMSAAPHYENALERLRTAQDKRREARATLYLARINGTLGNYGEAVDLFMRANEICDELGDGKTMAKVQRGLGYIHWRKGQNSEAVKHYNHSIRNSVEAEDMSGMARTFIELGNVYSHWGEHAKAIEYFGKSIIELERLNDHPELARAHNNLGDTYLRLKDWAKAIEAFDQCLVTAKKIGNKSLVAWAQFNSAEALAYTGELERAEELCNTAFDTCRILNDRFGMEGCFKNLGIVYRLKGDYYRSLAYLGKSVSLTDTLDIPYERGTTMKEIARTYSEMGDVEKAAENYRMARDLFGSVGSKADQDDIDRILAELGAAKSDKTG
jgi:tetratricopeptide (TPR) repeat protein